MKPRQKIIKENISFAFVVVVLFVFDFCLFVVVFSENERLVFATS